MKLRTNRNGPQRSIVRSILAYYDRVVRFVRDKVTVWSGRPMLINVLLFDIDHAARSSVTVNSYENLSISFFFLFCYGNMTEGVVSWLTRAHLRSDLRFDRRKESKRTWASFATRQIPIRVSRATSFLRKTRRNLTIEVTSWWWKIHFAANRFEPSSDVVDLS